MKIWLQLGMVLAVALLGAGVYAAGIAFPGDNLCLSPSGNWKIECRKDGERESAYALVLEDTSAKVKSEIFEGSRWCEVLWSRDESMIAITDWLGSNCSDLSIKHVTRGGRVAESLNVLEGVSNIISREELGGHRYAEAVYWDSLGRLYFRIFGHTDTNPSHGFIYYFRFDPKSGASVLVSKESGLGCYAEDKIYAERKK